MSILSGIGTCCMLLSVWAIIQLGLMGVFYHIEAVVLIEDVHAKTYEDYNDYIRNTKDNYKGAARNCWIVAGVYALTFLISLYCIKKGKQKDMEAAVKLADDEISCTPRPRKKTKDEIRFEKDMAKKKRTKAGKSLPAASPKPTKTVQKK